MSIVVEPGTPLLDLSIISIVPCTRWTFVSERTKLYIDGLDHNIRIGKVFLGLKSEPSRTLSGLYCRGWVFCLQQHVDDSEKEVRLIGLKDNFYGVFRVYTNANLFSNVALWRTTLNQYVTENFLERLIPGFTYEPKCQFHIKNVLGEVHVEGGIADELARAAYLQTLREFRLQKSPWQYQIAAILDQHPEFNSWGRDFPEDLRLEHLQEMVRIKERAAQRDQQMRTFLEIVELCGKIHNLPLAGFADRAMANKQVQKYFEDPLNGQALHVLLTVLETVYANSKAT